METPSDFIHLFQDRNFLQSAFDGKYYSIVGVEGAIGRRYAFGPFCIEYYTTDKEPELSLFKGLRLVIWNPITRTESIPFWKKIPFDTNSMVYAYIDIRDTDNYWKNWNRTFKYYCNSWAKQSKYAVIETSYEVFNSHYVSGAILDRNIKKAFSERMERHSLFQKNVTNFYLLQDTLSQDIFSGIATVDSFFANQTYYITGFTRKDLAPPQAGLWLLKHWMDTSSKKGIRYGNFGAIWTEGQPEKWKGFSRFKAKFNPKHLILPKEYYRFTFSLKRE